MLMLVCMNHTLAIKFCLNKNESSFFQQSKLGTYYGLKADDAGGIRRVNRQVFLLETVPVLPSISMPLYVTDVMVVLKQGTVSVSYALSKET